MRSWISVFILQRDEKLAISQGSIFVGWASSYTKLKEWLSGVCVTKMFSGQRKGKTILKTQHLIVEVPPSVSRWQVLPIAWFQLQWDNNRDGACKKGGVDNAKQIVMMGGVKILSEEVFTLGVGKIRPSTCVNWVLIEIPEERSIGFASYLLLFNACKGFNRVKIMYIIHK